MSSRPPRLSLPGWLLASLLSTLGVLIALYAFKIYSTLNEQIMQGFDRKLLAIATTTASFVDANEHASIIQPLPLVALTPNAGDLSFWASDPIAGRLWKIDSSDGSATKSALTLPAGFEHVAAGNGADTLVLANRASGELRLLSIASGATTPSFQLTPPVAAVASDPDRGYLYSVGSHLDRLDLRSGTTVRVAQLAKTYRSLAFDSRQQILWALDENGTELVNLNPVDGAERSRVNLALKKPEPAPADWKPSPVNFVALAFEAKSNRLIGAERTVLGGARCVLWIDPATGAVSRDGLRPNFNWELRPTNLRYALPLRRILNRTDLTFLYTQVLSGEDRIVYGADGTIGEQHSPPLNDDEVPATEIEGIKRIMSEGTPHLTQVKSWEQWGLIKSGWAPIFNSAGKPVAIAGADVNITTIRDATRSAVVITFSFGAMLLLLAGLVSATIARQLTRPIATIKAAALRAAAGDHAQNVEITRPRELTTLAVDFSAAAAGLGRSSKELNASASEGRATRDRRALTAELATMAPLLTDAPTGTPWAWGAHNPAEEIPSGGAVVVGENALVWCAANADDSLIAAIQRARIAVSARALLARHGADPVALAPLLATYAPGEIDAWILLTPVGIHVLSSHPEIVHRGPVGGVGRPVTSPEFTTLLGAVPGEAIVVAAPSSIPGPNAGASLEAWRKQKSPGLRFTVIFQPAA